MSLTMFLVAMVAYFFIGFWWAKYKAWQPLVWFFERILIPGKEGRDFTGKYGSYKDYRQKNVPWAKGLNFWLWPLTLGAVIFIILVCGIFISLPYWLFIRCLFTFTGKLINGGIKATSA